MPERNGTTLSAPPPPDDGVVLKDPWTATWRLPRWIVRLFGG